MTNDLAIRILTGDVLGTTEQTHEAVAMAVKALSALPSADAVSRQDAIDALHGYFDGMLETDTWSPCDVYGLIEILPSAQPDIIHCKDCKHWMPYDWMFSEVWRSVSMDDYSDDEIGCAHCDMNMHADDFCSRAERKTNE